jgi:subtilisin family serine protease
MAMPNQFVAAVRNPKLFGTSLAKMKPQWSKPLFVLGERSKNPVYLVEVSTLEPVTSATLSMVQTDRNVLWAQQNFMYRGDPREFTPNDPLPNDPLIAQQYHHAVMKNVEAWNEITATSPVAVAITDDGLAVKHPDIGPNLWVNAKEIPGNQIDDDQNGFVDDVNGWDFTSNDNDPSQGGSHGTHVAGIVAARLNNGEGGAGVAGWVSLMPLRFYGDAAWTSTLIAKTYAYAANNGARVMNTSYNVDGFVGDKIFESALAYLQEKGVLHFNSAGNNGQNNPARQKFEELVLVCSTDKNDKKSSFSNYGNGVDVCAPGSDILSTVIGTQKYGLMSGTSMATPNATGAAALIWSVHPEWTREQVLARLLATADSIDEQNPTYKGKLGAGRINTQAALTSAGRPSAVASLQDYKSEIHSSDVLDRPITSLYVYLSGRFERSSVESLSNWELKEAGADGELGTADDKTVSLELAAPYKTGSNRLQFNVSTLENGTYLFVGHTEVMTDPFQRRVDGTGFQVDFKISIPKARSQSQ